MLSWYLQFYSVDNLYPIVKVTSVHLDQKIEQTDRLGEFSKIETIQWVVKRAKRPKFCHVFLNQEFQLVKWSIQ